MILPVALAVIAATVAISASAGTMAKAGVRGLCACCGVDSDGAGDAAAPCEIIQYPRLGPVSAEEVSRSKITIPDRNAAFRRITVVENPQKKSVCCRIVQMQSGMGQGAKWMIGEMEFK